MHKILVPFAVVAVQIAGALLLQPAHAEASATQTLNPYSEQVIKTILDSCYGGSSSMSLQIPLSRRVGRSIQQLADEPLARMEQESIQQAKVLDASIKERFEQLKRQVKDKKKLQSELRQIEAVVETGQLNGKQIDPEQLASIKKSRDDIRKLIQDPSYLTVMAKEASEQEGTKIRAQLTAFKQKMSTCVCVSTTLQKQYTEQEFLRRSLEELQSGPALSKDWQAALQTCKAPISK